MNKPTQLKKRDRTTKVHGGHQPKKPVDPSKIVVPKPSDGIQPKRQDNGKKDS